MTAKASARDPYLVKSVVHSSRVLSAFRASGEALPLREIAARGGLPVQGSSPQAFRSGAVGWVDDQAQWIRPDGRTIPFRLTAVFHHDGEEWRMVQAHFSIGVPNG